MNFNLLAKYSGFLTRALLLSFFSLITYNGALAQKYGIIKGTVTNGSSGTALQGVNISKDSTGETFTTLQTGKYTIRISRGSHKLYFSFPGYQTKVIEKVIVDSLSGRTLNVLLLPLAHENNYGNNQQIKLDSAESNQAIFNTTFAKEKSEIIYNSLNNSSTITDIINAESIEPGTDKNAARLINRLNGVIVENSYPNQNIQSIRIQGLGGRYNQVLLNGSVINTANTTSRYYPLDILPVESIEKVALHKSSKSSLPANFAGGTIDIKTKDMPDENFFLLQVGGGFSSDTQGKEFFGDKKNSFQFLSFPGSMRDLPAGFPTTRSQIFFTQKNVQEQTDLSKTLNNNLGPKSYGKSAPDDRVLIGFGKIIKTKKDLTIGIIGFLNHTSEELIEESQVQVFPDVINNQYPFSDPSKKLIRSQSRDVNYNYLSQIGGTLNASVYFRNNKISIRNYFGNQLSNSLSVRNNISKPDEDTLANQGISYKTEAYKFLYTQIAGDHTFGEDQNFNINWQATYNYNRRQNPDERNFLFRRDSSNSDLFEIATPLSPDFNPNTQLSGAAANLASNFTNTSRLWRDYTEQNFNASVNLKVQVNLFRHPQILNGGLYIQSISRNFVSDLLLVKGKGYFTPDNILSADNYFPGGLTVTNYFSNLSRLDNETIRQTKRGNYFGASNVAASYLYVDSRFLNNIFFQGGLRLESDNRSTATVQYEYAPGLRYHQRFTIDDNTRQIRFNLLASANVMYSPVKPLQISANYARTISRPLLQELNAYNYYDAASFLVKSGNPFLDNAVIDNFGVGAKWLFDASSHISLNGFYKKIDQPVEDILTAYSFGNLLSRPFNMPPATVKGLRADTRIGFNMFTGVKWLSKISFFASGVLLKSEVKSGPVRNTTIDAVPSHTLSETPDYTFNAGIIVQAPHLPEFFIIYNRTGDYLSQVGSGEIIKLADGNSIHAIPDYRVSERGQLDLQIAQKFIKAKLQVIAGVTNLLEDRLIIYQDLNGNKKFDEPLSVTSEMGHSGFYKSGIDNTIINIKSQQKFFVRVSYLF